MGAWIEINFSADGNWDLIVAPFMGAWIEIFIHQLSTAKAPNVAPFMGAWIEIRSASYLRYVS